MALQTTNLHDAIELAQSDDRQVPFVQAANIITQHRGWSGALTRKAMIGALSRQVAAAFTGRSWHIVRTPDETKISEDIDGLIDARSWTLLHADHRSVVDGCVPSSDYVNWETGSMQVWRNVAVGELPADAANLVSDMNRYEVVEWEYGCQKITLASIDLHNLATDRKLRTYANWLSETTPGRRGPPRNEIWERTKAGLLAAALYDRDNLIIALRSDAGFTAYIRDKYWALDADGREPDGRDVARFVMMVKEALALYPP
jgi:hypothetical protein